MDVCNIEGRDCIEGNSTKTFNCSTTCVGIYADVHREDIAVEEDIDDKEAEQTSNFKELADLVRKEVMRMKRSEQGKRGAEDNERYKILVAEYRKFKEMNVKHFELNPSANSNAFGPKFGEFEYPCLKSNPLYILGQQLAPSTLQLVQIYFDTATFDDIERDKKIKTEAQLSLIGGTMGLLTGFSIISGVEIIFFLFRSISLLLTHQI